MPSPRWKRISTALNQRLPKWVFPRTRELGEWEKKELRAKTPFWKRLSTLEKREKIRKRMEELKQDTLADRDVVVEGIKRMGSRFPFQLLDVRGTFEQVLLEGIGSSAHQLARQKKEIRTKYTNRVYTPGGKELGGLSIKIFMDDPHRYAEGVNPNLVTCRIYPDRNTVSYQLLNAGLFHHGSPWEWKSPKEGDIFLELKIEIPPKWMKSAQRYVEKEHRRILLGSAYRHLGSE